MPSTIKLSRRSKRANLERSDVPRSAVGHRQYMYAAKVLEWSLSLVGRGVRMQAGCRP
jgi:hypothetical protein